MESSQSAAHDFRAENRLTVAYLTVAHAALFIGVILGFLQALEYAGIDLYPHVSFLIKSYYQGLSLHGVLNVLVWTTFFISGFLTFVVVRALGTPLQGLTLGWVAFALMAAGLILAAVPLLRNEATVMFTFYPPMKAHWAFYLGLTLVVVATWLVALTLYRTYSAWREKHPEAWTPLAAFMALVTFVMWTIASLGITAEMIFLLLPWSFGLIEGTDALLARTLFWFTGHPIVYFWLLPAYISWYTMVPRQAGGRLFSDPMARVSFLLFLMLSIPVGMHHQYADPGLQQHWKLLHAFLTFAVFFPSLLTFFNVVASLENGARARGGRGLVLWFGKLPWHDPSLVAQVLAMILFAFGGIGGLINASYSVNLVVHNTAWVPGHFHLTVGTAVTLTFMGISYWLVPYLRGRALWNRQLALVQAWLWFVGMAIFSHSLHRLGLMGMPRRTMIGASSYLSLQPDWHGDLPVVALGGTLLFISALFYFVNVAMTVVASRQPSTLEIPAAEAMSGPEEAPRILDRWWPWLAVTGLLILLAYGPTIARLVSTTPLNAPGYRVW
ncbi:MAG TPA: b(o/a)3-type cytochrome-c oxidase subunit 1 [Alphaproteobacteria bacterium]|nr:b(o/a)3-type cytochrome-c oxidase subunit 1 [Alphaproteobacteria bacterium]